MYLQRKGLIGLPYFLMQSEYWKRLGKIANKEKKTSRVGFFTRCCLFSSKQLLLLCPMSMCACVCSVRVYAWWSGGRCDR